MYRMYVDDQQGHERVEKYDFDKRVFNEKFNLKFQQNKKDRCDKCETFKNMPEIAKTPEMVDGHNKHIEEKENARDFKKAMKAEGSKDNVLSAAYDLEKVLLCPHGQTFFLLFEKIKIAQLHQTNIQSMETECFVWHEGDAKKGSSEIATCLQTYINNKNVTDIHLFSDRCGGQNMNRMVMVALHDIFLLSNLELLSMNFLVSVS